MQGNITPCAPESPDHVGLRMILRGDFEKRQLLRGMRTIALRTGAVGWARRRSDGSVEVVAYRADGLSDFIRRSHHMLLEAGIDDCETSDTVDAANEPAFKIRREQFLLQDTADIQRYQELGVDTSSRQFPALHTSGLLRSADITAIDDATKYWQETWGKSIDTAFHIAFSNLTNSTDVHVVPHSEFRSIWRFLNPGQTLIDAYSDKGLFRRLVNTHRQPVTHLICIDGRHYDGHENWLINESSVQRILRDLQTGIIKPTRDDNGRGVERLTYHDDDRIQVGERIMGLAELTRRYRGNFMVQEIAAQHNVMALPHPDSLNTLRVVTFRWRDTIHHLLTFARFGVGGRINDNAGTGGLCVGVDDAGRLHESAINEHGLVQYTHPTTGVPFASIPHLPGYTEICNFAIGLHGDIPYFDLLSWDFGIDTNGEPILIECNFRGASWLYQFATRRPLFGELTTDVLQTIKDKRRL